MKDKSFKKILRKILVVSAFFIMLGVGYLSTSIMTSCPAGAGACTCSICVYNGPSSTSGVIATISSSLTIPAIATATSLINAYYNLAMGAYAGQFAEKFSTLTYNLISWFNTFWYYALLPDMQKMTQQLNTIDTEQARAWAGFQDAVDEARTRRDIMDTEVNSHREYRPGDNVCVAGTVVGGMMRGSNIRTGYSSAAPVARSPRSIAATGTAAAKGRASDMKERWDTYVARYCDTTMNRGNAGCTANGAFANQDVDVAGQIFQKDTIDLKNNDVRQTVDDLLINIAEPFTMDNFPKGTVDTSPGRQAYMEGDGYKSKRQTIFDALYFIVARRAPGSDMADFIGPMRQQAGVSAAEISTNPSYNEVMEVMLSERFRTGKYSISQVDEPDNNDRELVIQQAFQLMQMSDSLDLMDKYSMMLAADTGFQVQQARPIYNRPQEASNQ